MLAICPPFLLPTSSPSSEGHLHQWFNGQAYIHGKSALPRGPVGVGDYSALLRSVSLASSWSASHRLR